MHLATALVYVDLNAVRAKLVENATDYPLTKYIRARQRSD